MLKEWLVIANNTLKGVFLKALAQASAGANEFGSLVMTGAFVDGDGFTVDVGSWTGRAHYEFNTDVLSQTARQYWVKFMTTGAGLTLGDATLNNTTAGVIRNVTVTAHGLLQGQIFAVGTEFFRVIEVRDVNTIDVRRGYAGSTVAAHTSTTALLTAANYTNVNLATDIILPITALALSTSGAQVATAMNALDGFNPKDYDRISSGMGKSPGSQKFGFVWEYISATTRFFFRRQAQAISGSNTTVAFADTVTNGTISTALTSATQVGEVKSTVESRVPTAGEVTAGILDFSFPWPVKSVQVVGMTTSTRAAATIGSTISYSADFTRVTLTNNGTNDFSALETVTLKVTG